MTRDVPMFQQIVGVDGELFALDAHGGVWQATYQPTGWTGWQPLPMNRYEEEPDNGSEGPRRSGSGRGSRPAGQDHAPGGEASEDDGRTGSDDQETRDEVRDDGPEPKIGVAAGASGGTIPDGRKRGGEQDGRQHGVRSPKTIGTRTIVKTKVIYDFAYMKYRFVATEIEDGPGKNEKGDALVEIRKSPGGEIVKEFVFPAYKVWNIQMHAPDIVKDLEAGLRVAASTGFGGTVLPEVPDND